MTDLPVTETLAITQDGPVLHVTLNRPEQRNAMSAQMVDELKAVFAAICDDPCIRAVVLRGAGGNFCAGGDIKDMAALRMKAASDPAGAAVYSQFNRAFGELMEQVNTAPQAVVTVLEGAVLGGGFGLACVSDVGVCHGKTQFGLPETGLGVIPAQIAPFVVQRVGLTQARRLALLGNRFGSPEAVDMGIAHQYADTPEELDTQLATLLAQLRRAAPQANRTTKALLHRSVNPADLSAVLDQAAHDFAAAVAGPEGQEGTMAFIQKRNPAWFDAS